MPLVSQDFRHGARIFGKTPAVTAIALAALALGIGASTAIFSVADAVLLKPLPFRDAGQLLVIWEKSAARGLKRMYVARGNYWEWSQQAHAFSAMAAIQDQRMNLTAGPNGHIEPEELKAERVTASLFPLLGVQAAIGRTFSTAEDQPGHANFAVLSHSLWTRRFGADRSIPGKTVRLRDQSFTVVGVLPAGFSLLEPDVDVWVPLALNPTDARSYGARTLKVIARLRPGIALPQADAEMETIGARLEAAHPALDSGWRPSLFAIRDELAGSTRRPILILWGAVSLLLLMACANVASLLLARGAARRKEVAIRFALGASRGRVVAQLLTESVFLALAGGALGVALASGAIALVRAFGPASIPQLRELSLDGRVLLFALAISIATGILFGILPALNASSVDLSQALNETSRGGTAGRRGRSLRAALIVAEVALAVVVLIAAGLLVRSFLHMRAADPGFRAGHVLTLRLPLVGGRNGTRERSAPFIHQALDQVSALPGVRSTAAITSLPLAGLDIGTTFEISGLPAAPLDQRAVVPIRYISPGYFSTLGIPILAGRAFSESDTADAPPVVIVNRTLARRYFPNSSPIGQHLVLDTGHRTAEIAGVCGDVKQEKLVGEEWPTIYHPYPQAPPPYIVLALRSSQDPRALALSAEREIHRIDPDQPVTEVRTMRDLVDRSLAEPRFDTVLLTVLAAIAFLLAAVGIYGVISCDVHDRTHELGIRMALGAQRGDVLRLVLGRGAKLAAAGIAIGLAASISLTHLMTTMLYGVHPADVFTFAAIAFALGAVALAASYIPSRRAMALDPMAALRHE